MLLDYLKVVPRAVMNFIKMSFTSMDMRYAFFYRGSIYNATFNFNSTKITLVSLNSGIGMEHTEYELKNIITNALIDKNPENVSIRVMLSDIGATNIHYIR